MKLEELAIQVIEAAETLGVDFMAVGAIAAGAYGIPRSTRDVDFLVSIRIPGAVNALIAQLDSCVQFDPQVVFDTITWGRRHIGQSRGTPPFKVELFETFDDPFVDSEFGRRQRVFVPMLNRSTWLPTPEDVIVQKLRWGQNCDGDGSRILRTPAMCSRCRALNRSTCPTSSSGVRPTVLVRDSARLLPGFRRWIDHSSEAFAEDRPTFSG